MNPIDIIKDVKEIMERFTFLTEELTKDLQERLDELKKIKDQKDEEVTRLEKVLKDKHDLLKRLRGT